MATIDPRKLARLAKAARALGLSRLRVGADGSAEFDLAADPDESRSQSAAPPPVLPARPERGSDAWLRNRLRRKN